MHLFRATLSLLALGSFLAPAEQRWDIQYRYRDIDSTFTINDLVFPSAQRGIARRYTTDRKDKDRSVVLLTSDGGQQWAETPVKETGLALFFLTTPRAGW